jgi:hypothetical protein
MAEQQLTIKNKLRAVQHDLKVPKSQRNSFGNYNYRSCEDILEAVKPLLDQHGLVLLISDEVVCVGDRNYVKAVAELLDKAESIRAAGYAREDETKKGMDGSQITGAASSYARKYALNGLFAIDDTKDADTDAHTAARSQTTKTSTQPAKAVLTKPAAVSEPATPTQKAQITALLRANGIKDENFAHVVDMCYGMSLTGLTKHHAAELINQIKEVPPELKG